MRSRFGYGLIVAAGLFAVMCAAAPPGALAQNAVTTHVTVAKLHSAPVEGITRALGDQPAPDAPLAVTTTSTLSVGFTNLVDGHGQMTTGVTVPLYTVLGTRGKLKLVSITAIGISNNTAGNVYTGTGLSYLVFANKAGLTLSVIAGWKGFNLSSGFGTEKGFGNAILGGSLSIPIGKV